MCGGGGERGAHRREEVDREAGLAFEGQVCDCFADDGCEFEPVAAARAGDDDIAVIWVEAQSQVTVGRVGVHAHADGE